MNKTIWKPIEEIEFTLRDAQKVSIISCGTCANLCGTGGIGGMKYLEELLKSWGKDVILARCVIACCPEAIMRQAFNTYKRQIMKSDSLVVLSCAAGIKSANLCKPDIPVVTLLDPVGSVAITHQDNYVANSVCNACGNCVITYTGGICPLSECPARSKYGPCKKAPEQGDKCTVDETISCIWKEIDKRGDLVALAELRKLHKDEGLDRPAPPGLKNTPPLIRKLSGRFAARVQSLERIIRLIR